MTRRHWTITAYISFGLLGIMYLGLVFLPLSAVGGSWILSPATPEEKSLVITLLLRTVGALLCIAILIALALSPRGRTLGAGAAWALAVGGTAVVTWDTARSEAPVGVWGMVILVALFHLWLVRTFYMASRQEAL